MPMLPLSTVCAASELFAVVTRQLSGGVVQMCSASPYVAKNCWQDGRMKIGDAAFAIDPISSSGVEKAMRFSLQVAIAVHTLLQADGVGQQALAAQFYRQRLIEVHARHAPSASGTSIGILGE
jgi:flavin-dependent dehydrogenase